MSWERCYIKKEWVCSFFFLMENSLQTEMVLAQRYGWGALVGFQPQQAQLSLVFTSPGSGWTILAGITSAGIFWCHLGNSPTHLFNKHWTSCSHWYIRWDNWSKNSVVFMDEMHESASVYNYSQIRESFASSGQGLSQKGRHLYPNKTTAKLQISYI